MAMFVFEIYLQQHNNYDVWVRFYIINVSLSTTEYQLFTTIWK